MATNMTTPRTTNHRTEVFGISARNNENLFNGVTLTQKIAPSKGITDPQASLKRKSQVKETHQSIIIRLPQIADDESEISTDSGDELTDDSKLVEPQQKMKLPIPVRKRKKVPELRLKSIPTCEVVQFTDREIDTLKQEERVVYYVRDQPTSSHSKEEVKVTTGKQLVNKVEINMDSQTTAKQSERLPSLLKGIMDEKNARLLYIPLTEMKTLCHIKNKDQQSPAVSNLSSIRNFQELRFTKYKANMSSRGDPEKHNISSSKPHEDVESLRSSTGNSGHSADEATGPNHYNLRNSNKKGFPKSKGLVLDNSPLMSKSFMAIPRREGFVLPDLLVEDASKHKTGRDKVLQQKFDETIKIYQRTKEKIYKLECKAKLETQRRLSKFLPKRPLLQINRSRRTQSEGSGPKRQLPPLEPLNDILSHIPAIRCPTSPPPFKKNATAENSGSDTQGSRSETKPSRKTPRRTLTEKQMPKRDKTSLETAHEQITRQMFQASDYDQYCHTKHRRSRHNENSQTPRDMNPNPREYLNVKIGTDPRLLDDNDYVTDGVQVIPPDTKDNSGNALFLVNEPMENGKLSDAFVLPRLVATDNQKSDANKVQKIYSYLNH